MKLGDLLQKISEEGFNHTKFDPRLARFLDNEVVVHKAGEKADNVVNVEIVQMVRSIYLEYE